MGTSVLAGLLLYLLQQNKTPRKYEQDAFLKALIFYNILLLYRGQTAAI